MAGKGNVPIARALVLVAILIQVIAVIIELLNLASVRVSIGNLNGVMAGVLHGLYVAVIVVVSIVFILINYSMIYLRMHRKSSKARDYCLLFGIIEILFGILLLPELMTVGGVLLILAWIVLEL